MAEHIDEMITIDGVDLHVVTVGTGPAVLLLHGFPQTHRAWRRVAPALASDFTVVAPDLPGYGHSGPPLGGDDPDRYAKRATASTMVAAMRHLGHARFTVVGHDRGALVAFRAALDHPDAIERLAVLDVIPAVDMWAALHGTAAVFAFHLAFLAHPGDLPERMIGAAPDTFFGHFLDTWVHDPAAIDGSTREEYLRAAGRPEAIHAVCQDYRASAGRDLEHDRADQEAGRRLAMPVLAMWQDPGDTPLPFDPAAVWASWAPDLRTRVLRCGHFLPEERPDEVVAAIRELVTAGGRRD